MPKDTTKTTRGKPAKPHKDFPLFPHATKRWAKKVRGKLCYFGPWDDPDAALAKWLDQRDDLLAGRTPRVRGDGLTVADLCNRFLTAKRHLLDTREITARTFADCYKVCERIISAFGRTRLASDLASDDFEALRATMAKTLGALSLGIEIQRIRSVFKYGHDANLMESPVRYGAEFKKPSRKVIRAARQANGPRMFEAEEIRKLLKAADGQLKAMIMLAINCGMGNRDVALLPIKAIDLAGAWLDYPRPKTAVPRRCPLWPETIAALKQALAKRPTPKQTEAEGLAFVTRYGACWVRTREAVAMPAPDASGDDGDAAGPARLQGAWIDSVGLEFGKLLRELDLKRPGLNYYALRHTFATVAGAARDQIAVDSIMGHAPDASDMAAVYRERIGDDRLQAVVNHVRAWLFPATAKPDKDVDRKATGRRTAAK